MGEKVTVRRKFKTSHRADSPTKTKWWFVVRGAEAELQQLQLEWASVAVQTAWKLEPAFSYADEPTPEQHLEQPEQHLEQPEQQPVAVTPQADVLPQTHQEPEQLEQSDHCPSAPPTNNGNSTDSITNNEGKSTSHVPFLDQQ